MQVLRTPAKLPEWVVSRIQTETLPGWGQGLTKASVAPATSRIQDQKRVSVQCFLANRRSK
jgi:hypothetical protein